MHAFASDDDDDVILASHDKSFWPHFSPTHIDRNFDARKININAWRLRRSWWWWADNDANTTGEAAVWVMLGLPNDYEE